MKCQKDANGTFSVPSRVADLFLVMIEVMSNERSLSNYRLSAVNYSPFSSLALSSARASMSPSVVLAATF